MSSQTSYKWKFKKDRKKSKPYERPSNETWLSRVASTIKESIPSWIPYWPFATSYDQNHDRDELTEIESETHVENVKDNVRVKNNRTNETPFELKRPVIMAEQKLDDDPLVNKLISTSAKNRKSDAKLDPVPGLTLHPIPSTSKATSQCPVDEDGSSSTENTASSTSGCSSLVPSNQYHLQRLGIPFSKEVKELEKKRKEIMKKTRDVGVETEVKNLSRSGCKRSFLWTDPSISILNSSRLVSNMASGTNRANKSPFYEGKTSFGGTSAKRPRFSAPYYKPQTSALNTGVKLNGGKVMDHSDILSDAAKKILANIEKISSPIEDAKRMPVLGSFDPTKYTLEPNRPFRRGKMPNFTLPEATSSSSLNSQVSITNPQLKWASPEEAVKISTNNDKKEITSQNTASFVGKMRARVSKPNIDQICLKNRKDEITSDSYLNEVISPKMKNLPSFNFANNVKQISHSLPINVGKSKSRVTTTTVVEVNKKQSGDEENEFFFSPPLQASEPSTIKEPNSSEIKSIDLCILNQNTNQTKVKSQSAKDAVPKEPIKTNVPQKKVSKDALLEEDKNYIGLNKASEDNKLQQSDSVKASTDNWACSTCLIFNPLDKNICMACDSVKPGTINIARSPSVEINFSYENSGKNEDMNTSVKPSNQWTCTTCLIVNSSEKSACMACEASKPGLMKNPCSTASFKFNVIDMESKDVNKNLKPQSDNWTCNTSFIPNPEEKLVCVACEIPKTGTTKTITTTTSGIKFGFDKVEKDKEVISNIRSEQLDSSSDNRFKQQTVSSISLAGATNKESDKAKPTDRDEPKADKSETKSSRASPILKGDDLSNNKSLNKTSSTNDSSISKSEMRLSQPITTQIEISTEKPTESNKNADKEKIKVEKSSAPTFTFGGSVIDSRSSEKALTSSSISIFSSKKDSREENKSLANVSASSDVSSSSLMNVETLDDKPREGSVKIMKDGDNSFTNATKFPEKSSPWPESFSGFGKDIDKSKVQTSGFSSNSGFKFDANANKSSGLGSNSSTTTTFTSLSQPATYEFSLKLPLNQAASTAQSNPPSFFGSTPVSSSSTPALSIPTGSTAVSTSESKESGIGFEPRPAESTFKFGSSSGKPSLQKGTFSSPSFSDLRSSTVMKPGTGAIPDSTSKGFTFGNKLSFASPATSETPSVPSTSAPPLFSFSSNISTLPKSPVFGFGSSSATSQIMPSGFSFDPKTTSNCADTIGSVTSNLAPAAATSSSIMGSVQNPPVFSFGNPTGNSTPAFQFGSATTNTASSNNAFIFGSQNSASNLVTHGLQSSAPKPFENPFAKASGDFTFGNTSSSTSQAPSAPSGLFSSANQNSGISSTPGTLNFSTSPSFNFAESSAQSGALFQFTANNPGSPLPPADPMRRNIKKARRRLGQS